LTGIIDWECVHTVSLWFACRIPKLIDADVESPADLDDVYASQMYYTKIQLAKVFLEEMLRVFEIYMDDNWKLFLKEVIPNT
jgi:hypothetical protein